MNAPTRLRIDRCKLCFKPIKLSNILRSLCNLQLKFLLENNPPGFKRYYTNYIELHALGKHYLLKLLIG